MADRLREARLLDGRFKTATEAARALRIEAPTYLGHENGSRGFNAQVERYAAFYRVSYKWLKNGIGTPRGKPIEAKIIDLTPEEEQQVSDFIEFLKRKRPE